jgi:hypothetical protein
MKSPRTQADRVPPSPGRPATRAPSLSLSLSLSCPQSALPLARPLGRLQFSGRQTNWAPPRKRKRRSSCSEALPPCLPVDRPPLPPSFSRPSARSQSHGRPRTHPYTYAYRPGWPAGGQAVGTPKAAVCTESIFIDWQQYKNVLLQDCRTMWSLNVGCTISLRSGLTFSITLTRPF